MCIRDRLIRNVGHLMTSPSIILGDNSEIPEIPNPINQSIISFCHAVFLNDVVIFLESLCL